MPVTKKTTTSSRRTKKMDAPISPSPLITASQNPKACCRTLCCHLPFAKKIVITLIGILLAYLIIFFGTLIRNNIESYSYIGSADRQERVLSIDAVGTAVATPDIAMTTMGVVAEGETVASAQEKSSKVLNTLMLRLKDMGVAKEDIQTANYNIYPRYDYTEEDGRVLRGYEVNQQVEVKIRDIDRASEVLALAGELGVTNVSGLIFTIDETDVYVDEARNDAMNKLREKIDTITTALGVEVVEIISYDEYLESNSSSKVYQMMFDSALSAGGGAPSIEAGTDDIQLRVQVRLEINS